VHGNISRFDIRVIKTPKRSPFGFDFSAAARTNVRAIAKERDASP
jgi:hypothetical protein